MAEQLERAHLGAERIQQVTASEPQHQVAAVRFGEPDQVRRPAFAQPPHLGHRGAGHRDVDDPAGNLGGKIGHPPTVERRRVAGESARRR
jgi:hypothetical protein